MKGMTQVARSPSNGLWWDGANWSAWDWVGGYFQGNPAAVSWGPNRLDVFAWGNTQHLGHLWMG